MGDDLASADLNKYDMIRYHLRLSGPFRYCLGEWE